MGEPLEADVVALRVLAVKLSDIAGEIDGLSLNQAITMPGMRIGAVAAVAPHVMLGAYKAIGGGIRAMGDAAGASAASYEEM